MRRHHYLCVVLFLSGDRRSSETTERQVQRMWQHPQATTAAKVGIIAHVTASSGAMTNAMDAVAWRQSRTIIDDDDDDNNQCQ